jgi:hypothetical protein
MSLTSSESTRIVESMQWFVWIQKIVIEKSLIMHKKESNQWWETEGYTWYDLCEVRTLWATEWVCSTTPSFMTAAGDAPIETRFVCWWLNLGTLKADTSFVPECFLDKGTWSNDSSRLHFNLAMYEPRGNK